MLKDMGEKTYIFYLLEEKIIILRGNIKKKLKNLCLNKRVLIIHVFEQ